jgi:cytosine/adenosine deaminase-related metal-dependent hydrolase
MATLASACGSSDSGGTGGTTATDAGKDSGKKDGGKDSGGDSGDDDATTGDDDGGGQTLTRCKTTKSGTSGVMLVGTVLAPENAYNNGEVLIDASGIIQCAGAAGSCDAAATAQGASTVTCANAVISPGLINAHDHITYDNDAPQTATMIRYNHRNEWREGTDGFTRNDPSGNNTDYAGISYAELRFLMGGVTSIVASGGEYGLTRNLDNSNSALYEGLNIQKVDFDVFPLNDTGGTSYPSGCTKYSTARETTTEVLADDAYLPHIAEGIDLEANNEITCQSVAPNDLIQKQTAIIHSVAVNATQAANYQANGTSVVWSPRSNISLYGNTAPVTMLDTQGVMISLGTDWLPSGSMNLQRELACADSLNTKYFASHFSDRQLWEMVTTNPAYATGVASATGLLQKGLAADIAIFDASVNTSYRAVIAAAADDVILVLRGGKAIYGDKAIMSDPAFGQSSCEGLEVCGAARLACVTADSHGYETLAKILADGQPNYELFNCKGDTPPNEPTCTPWRTSYPDGITATDKDGDGVPDSADNCPTIFNAVRLMDSNDVEPTASSPQPDTDGDGIGDACDPCPLASGTCIAPKADDIDSDGVTNNADNCPKTANQDQTDSDGDGVGDACEYVSTIPSVRNPADANHPVASSIVEVKGVYVTAVRSSSANGFYVQDPSASTYGALFVNSGSITPAVSVGNVVNVTGEYVEVSGVTTLLLRSFTVTDSGTSHTVAPVSIPTPTSISTKAGFEPYESMLVQLGQSYVSSVNPDGPKQDFDEFMVIGTQPTSCASLPDGGAPPGGLRIDDELYAPLDNTYACGTSFSQITGIAGSTFSEYKVWPRSAAEFTTP